MVTMEYVTYTFRHKIEDFFIFADENIKEVKITVANGGTSDDSSQTYVNIIWNNWTADNHESYTNGVFKYWMGESNGTGTTIVNNCYQTPVHKETEEEKKLRLVKEEQWKKEAEEREKENRRRLEMRKIAEDRAFQLLLDHLTENQKEIYTKTGCIPIKGSLGGDFQIDKMGSIYEVDKLGKKINSICIHPQEEFPMGDVILSKKLFFEICEEEARKVGHFNHYSS